MSAATSATPRPRHSGSRPLLLPGQTAAPDGPVDLMPMWLMHHGFRRDLDAFVRAVDRTPIDDRATWRALRRRWELFARILHDHHTGEDAGLWPLLLARVDAAGNAPARATLEAMAAEHGGIAPLLGACSVGFARLAAAAGDDDRETLAAAVAAAREHLARHLAHEERDGMRVLQEHLTQAEWVDIGRRYFDPASTPAQLLGVIAWALHDLPPEGLARMRSQDRGPLIVGIWRLALRRPFARRERAAFRYA